jgi:hypothetical protein
MIARGIAVSLQASMVGRAASHGLFARKSSNLTLTGVVTFMVGIVPRHLWPPLSAGLSMVSQ